MERVCVYCGSSPGNNPVHAQMARRLGQELASRGLELVFGAGRVGLMGILADAVLTAGGRATGVIPQALATRELTHPSLTETLVVADMHERKATMAQRSDAFIALPGGYGTMEELFEMITWGQLGFHAKPVGVLNSAGFFGPLLALLDHMAGEGFIQRRHRELVVVAAEPVALLDELAAARPPVDATGRDQLEG